MSYIMKPKVLHPAMLRNKLGLTLRDYEGSMSTLCAGCGHDSITAAIVQAFFELSIPHHRVAKLSGIGCSSKTPTYFLGASHGFNSAHGRMPAIASGAAAANRDLIYIGVSGDGDSLSIGLGQLAHAIRRNLNMLYVLENNGVYGLTKGQFSASADVGTKSKKGEANTQLPIDPVLLALSVGATFIARGFSGDKKQLLPLLKAAIAHKGFALIDIISPCVTFNDHEGSTKSYLHTRKNNVEVLEAHYEGADERDETLDPDPDGSDAPSDFVPLRGEITADYPEGTTLSVRMHDGSRVHFSKVPQDYDPRVRDKVFAYLTEKQDRGEIPTGLLYINEQMPEMHDQAKTTKAPLSELGYEKLCPGSETLAQIMAGYR